MADGAATPKVTMTISLMSDGRVVVNGPISDRMLCYALLEMARDAVKDAAPKDSVLLDPTGTPL